MTATILTGFKPETYHRFILLLLVLPLVAFFSKPLLMTGTVLGASTLSEDSIRHKNIVATQTAFDQKEEVEYEDIEFDTEYEDNPDLEYGLEEVLQEGKNGLKTLTYLVTFWQDDIIDRKLIDTKIDSPTEEIISLGKKIVWKMYSTPDVGRVRYWYKIKVWATKYDANCIGCTGRTYSGTEVVKGVCATDPKVIPLGTNFYVEGYGLCRAEDIGGAIKGNKVDLGYVDAAKGEWRTGWTMVYLLTNAPE
ncbi:MAG: G5 domain-containing protein [Patescibacteria group bacterium]|jgi:3D (Asp-Asp-Asp) domain-containing protein